MPLSEKYKSHRQIEAFQPVRHTKSSGMLGTGIYALRLFFDMQNLTILRHIEQLLLQRTSNSNERSAVGNHFLKQALLDVGCGDSPYRHLLERQYTYHGIDTFDSSAFGYHNPGVTYFDGKSIPFPDGHFDAILCTEVLEHVHDYRLLVDEMYRVLKPGAIGVITVPWSARYHYIPNDYFRYTPSTLQLVFSSFSNVEILARGNAFSVISNKCIVLAVSVIKRRDILGFASIPIIVLTSPLIFVLVIASHIGLWLDVHSMVDPLGYSIRVTK
jgi:SAM-dependent methyltransferase